MDFVQLESRWSVHHHSACKHLADFFVRSCWPFGSVAVQVGFGHRWSLCSRGGAGCRQWCLYLSSCMLLAFGLRAKCAFLSGRGTTRRCLARDRRATAGQFHVTGCSNVIQLSVQPCSSKLFSPPVFVVDVRIESTIAQEPFPCGHSRWVSVLAAIRVL